MTETVELSGMQLAPEERSLVAAVADSVNRDLAPIADEIDRTASFPIDFYRALGQIGYFTTFVPESYGGISVSSRASLACVEQIARVSAATALSFGNCGDAVGPIIAGGSAELCQDVLPSVATGESIPAFCLTEPESGSDAANITTRAERDNGGYRITGQKVYITNGSVSDYLTVFARTSPDAKTGISCFLIPTDAPGVRIGRDEELLGLRGMPATVLNFDEVQIPESNRLGDEGAGLRLAMMALDEARLNISAVALGVARRGLDESVRFARERRSFGKAVIDHDGMGFLLADLATELASAWSVFERAVNLHETHAGDRDVSAVVSMAKLAATRVANNIAGQAVQVHGGGGFTKEYVVERLYRDARAFEILDGTSQIQQLIVARHLRKKDFPYQLFNW